MINPNPMIVWNEQALESSAPIAARVSDEEWNKAIASKAVVDVAARVSDEEWNKAIALKEARLIDVFCKDFKMTYDMARGVMPTDYDPIKTSKAVLEALKSD